MITLTYSVIANLVVRPGDRHLGLRRDQRHPGAAARSAASTRIRTGSTTSRSSSRSRSTLLLRYVARTPFGLTLQGVRDDPVRMASLGYNVVLHRTIAFAFASFIAAIGGVLFVWWNGHIDPASIDLGATIDVLVIAVIGGLYRLEGAWVGALFFVIINNYSQQISFIGPRFHTLIGAIFLVIVLVSPGGLVGLWERAVDLSSGRRRGPSDRNSDRGRPGGAQRLKGGLDTPTTSWHVTLTPQQSASTIRKEEGIRMNALKRKWKLVPLAALVVVRRRARGDDGDRSQHRVDDQDRRPVRLSGRVRLVRQPGPRRCRHRDGAVRRREGEEPEQAA